MTVSPHKCLTGSTRARQAVAGSYNAAQRFIRIAVVPGGRAVADSNMAWARLDPAYVPPEIDTTKPSVARVYDAILGGKDNFAVDRAIAEQSVKAMGDGGSGARLNRAMLGRAVRFMAAHGISQFLDLGSGLPTVQNTHQIAQAVNPAARVVYVDNDPSVSLHGRALLAADAATAVVLADVMEPDKLLGLPEVTGLIDFTQPVGLIMNAVIHHILDEEDPYGVVAAYKDAAVPGSYMQITHFCDAAPEAAASVRVLRENLGRGQIRSREEIKRFFDGWEIVAPGLVFLSEWRPEEPVTLPLDVGSILMLAGVARKP
jgi:acetylglutamate kinase